MNSNNIQQELLKSSTYFRPADINIEKILHSKIEDHCQNENRIRKTSDQNSNICSSTYPDCTTMRCDDTNSSSEEEMSPALFVELMSQFYRLGWMMGSSGGMAALNRVANIQYFSPSSVQKERLKEADLFVFNMDSGTLVGPSNKNRKESACAPLFRAMFDNTGCDCVIHIHSKYSNMLTQLISGNKFEISNQEMLKGILKRSQRGWSSYTNTELLVVPIIENAPQEYMLMPALHKVFDEFQQASAVLVRNHGIFVWGPTWQKTKIMLECYEYLFELACEMLRFNLSLI